MIYNIEAWLYLHGLVEPAVTGINLRPKAVQHLLSQRHVITPVLLRLIYGLLVVEGQWDGVVQIQHENTLLN